MTTHTQEQKVARHVQEVTGLSYTTCLAATRSARLRVEDGPDFTKRWQDLAIRDATARALGLKRITPATAGDYVGDTPKAELRPVPGLPMAPPFMQDAIREWKKTVAEQHDAERQSRGVEGELKPLLKAHRQCGNRFCRKSALAGSAFCEDHSDESQPLKSTGRKP